MIKINLLPSEKGYKKKSALINHGMVAGISLIITCLILIFLQMHMKGKAKALDRQIINIKNELKNLEKNEKRIQELKASEAIFQKKIDVIKRLEQRKTGPARMLDAIASKISEKMWLTSLKSQGPRLSLDGIAIDNETIAQFMTNIEDSDQFDNVALKVAQETKVEDFMFKKFTITCTIKIMKEPEEKNSKPTQKTKKK